MSLYHALKISVLTALIALSLTAKERVMIGENVYVGPDETLDAAVCIACSLRVAGTVGEAVVVAGGMEIEEGGKVERDVVVVAGGLKMLGEVGGNAVVVMGGIEAHGKIGGDAVAVMGGVDLKEGAEIGGDAVAVMGGVGRISDDQIGGDVVGSEILKPIAISAFVFFVLLFLAVSLALWPFVSFVTFSILGAPRVEVIVQTLNQRTGMCLLIGVGAFFGSIMASAVLSVVLFWAPSAELLVGLAFFATAAVGYCGVSLWLGRGIVRTGTPLSATIVGSILITVIQLIPVVGWFLAWPVFALLALGAAALSGYGTSPDWLLPRAGTDPMVRPVAR